MPGRPLKVILTPGQQGDITTAPALLEGIPAEHVLADKAYDSNALRGLIGQAGQGRHPLKPNAQEAHPPRHAVYKRRNQIERCFNRLKNFRRFATRYDRRAVHFLAFIHLACAMIWMR